MNPLLQRFLISWAAGIATTGVVVGTAKRPHKLKRRRRKKRKGQPATPVHLGAQALLDAGAPADPGLSVEEWAASVKALPGRVASIFHRVPKEPADGVREPDEIRTADGQKVAANTRGKKRRRRGPRKQATLWDSAKESMRQTVHEVVKEEVKDTPVGNAVDAARKAGDKVREGAVVVKEGAAVVAENAVRAGAQVGDRAKSLLNRILIAVEADPAPNADPEAEALAAAEEAQQHEAPEAAADAAAVDVGVADTRSDGAAISAASSAASSATNGAAAVDVAAVGRKLRGGFNAVGDWLSGPGAPGYTSTRVRPATASGDIVEAKDTVEVKDTVETTSVADAPTPPTPESSDAAEQVGHDQQREQDGARDDEGTEERRDEAGE